MLAFILFVKPIQIFSDLSNVFHFSCALFLGYLLWFKHVWHLITLVIGVACTHLIGVLWHLVWSAHELMILLFSPFLPSCFFLFLHSFLYLFLILFSKLPPLHFSNFSLLTVAALAFSLAATAQAPRIITGPAPVLPQAALRTPTPAGPTLMPLIRQIQTAVMPNGSPHPTATLVPQGPEGGLIYTPYDYPYTLAPGTSILEYPIETSGVLGKLWASLQILINVDILVLSNVCWYLIGTLIIK